MKKQKLESEFSTFTPESRSSQQFMQTTRTRKRFRQEDGMSHRYFFRQPLRYGLLLAVVLLSSWTDHNACGPFVVLADQTTYTKSSESFQDTDGNPRKPYRSNANASTKRGKLKLVPIRRHVIATPQRSTSNTLDEATTLQAATTTTTGRPSLEGLVPFFQRGALLAVLGSLALLETNPGGVFSLASPRLDYTKIWKLPSEILPSLSSALLIAWVPSLVLQGAWWEIGFLCVSLTSQAHLRNYLLEKVLPAMGGTFRKLVWSEFWKKAWDFLLEPFSHNILIPPGIEGGGHGWTESISQFWSKRVVSRIDKWTVSSLKALFQKNVQNSVDGLAEDSLQALFSKVEVYAWYGNNDIRALSNEQTTTAQTETIQMELECDEEPPTNQESDAAQDGDNSSNIMKS